MTTVSNEKESYSPCEPGCNCTNYEEPNVAEATGREANEICGPSCACAAPPTFNKAKILISALIFMAALAIILFKLTGCSKSKTSANNSVKPQITQDIESVGEELLSLRLLNKVAAAKEAVFILVPQQDSLEVKTETVKALNAAKQKLEAKGITIGLYTLNSDTPDYLLLSL